MNLSKSSFRCALLISLLAAPSLHAQELIDLGNFGVTPTAGGMMPGLPSSTAAGVNNAGQVVGSASTTYGTTAFLYSNGTLTDLNTVRSTSSQASSINDSGQVVGNYYTSGGNQNAFLYSNGAMSNLELLELVARPDMPTASIIQEKSPGEDIQEPNLCPCFIPTALPLLSVDRAR